MHLSARDLLQPRGGLFGAEARVSAGAGEPGLVTHIARLGDVSQIWARARPGPPARRPRAEMNGSSSGIDGEACTVRALAEGIERYSAAMFGDEQCVRASARELGRAAIDLDRVPRCSERELSHPRCPLVAPDKRAPIRWVRGLSLADGRPVHVPAVMVFLSAGTILPGERICLPITTGCAAHASYERALVSGLLEVIERDAISITWLQKLPLPRLDVDVVPPALAPYWERYERSSPELEYLFFDATTDLGIPTVYGIQIARASRQVRTLVACAADFDPARAVAKVICDMTSARLTHRQARPVPDDWDLFTEVHHGATFMARADQAQAFDFLLRSRETRALSRMPRLDAADDFASLRLVLERLQRCQVEAFAADVSSDEALRAGLRVVRALVPGLQPLSFHYRARYLGHPRLYEAPRAMGHQVRQELQVNHWPQPFD